MAQNIQERLIKLSLDENWHCFHSTFQQNKYYIPYPHMIRKCYGMSMNERGVLLDILSHLGENEEAFPSQETIACNLGISESTVKSAITSLEEKKFIKTVRRRGQVNRYRIDQLEANPYLVLSENVHFFLRLYQPRYIKKTLIQSVIANIINGDSYKSYANRLYEAYHSKQPYLDIAYETVMELLDEIRERLWLDKGIKTSLPIYSDFQYYANLYSESIGFEDGDECDWDEHLKDEGDQSQGQ
ncbi:helix-turn-helix domain-containing protein [Paenibacillus polymyxa]|nr:helix-turn-helix domain-containing protein [Paenibacillus polymyxa]